MFGGKPFDQQRGAHIVGKVGGDPHAARQKLFFVQFQRIGLDDLKLAGISGRDLCQRRQAAGSRSTAITRSAPSARSARVKPPGPGPTS